MKSFFAAFSMYSKFPVPQVAWDQQSLSWALCWFPVVGWAIGLLLLGWLLVWRLLALTTLGAAVAVILPIALSGGIHLDGFCDTCDALSSRQSRERKLEIMKDSHAGAFAIICCGLYLLLLYAAWREVVLTDTAVFLLSLTPVFSRALSALAAVSWKNARGSGLLATFTKPIDARRARFILSVLILFLAGAMCAVDLFLGAIILGVAAATFLCYRQIASRHFGGITGDTAGWFLQICECALVLSLVLGQRLEYLL